MVYEKWYGMVMGMVWYGMIMVWYGIIWLWYGYGMVWYGMVWYGMGGQTFVGGVKRRKETWPCIWVYPQRVEEIMVLLHGL